MWRFEDADAALIFTSSKFERPMRVPGATLFVFDTAYWFLLTPVAAVPVLLDRFWWKVPLPAAAEGLEPAKRWLPGRLA